MATRTRYDVAPDKRNGGWQVKVGDGSSRFDTKQEAVKMAAREAKTQGNSQVIIRKKDGTIQSERTYVADPRGTKG